MKKLVLDNDFATVWVYPEKKIIHHRFKKFIHGDVFRNVLLTAQASFEEYGCTKWLSDDRENVALTIEDRDWSYDVWEPMVLKAGWKYWALLLPHKNVGQTNMKKVSAHYEDLGVNVQFFNEPEEAFLWLEKQ